MATYWVIYTRANGVDRTPMSKLFATPFQAAGFVDRMVRSPSYSYHIRPADWREREERMFENDLYQHPVWYEEKWWNDCKAHFREHYLHVSLADPECIAFTEDKAKGEADRQTSMRPGKYLQKFLGAGPDGKVEHGPLKGWAPRITKMQVAYYAQWHHHGQRPPSEDVLDFTEDPDEIVRVYEEGPPSCMMGKNWSVPDHPVRVYAGGGLKMAYLTSVSGEVIARALCWPANEVFGRVYPTPTDAETTNHYDELMARLKALGWTSITEDNTVFEGALLTKVRARWHNYVMPYLDNEYGVEAVYRDGKDWWRMTQSAVHQDSTDGELVEDEERWECESCNEMFSEDNDCSYTVYTSWRRSSGRGATHGYGQGDAAWCESCRDSYAFYCEGSEEYYDNSEATYVEVGYDMYERNWFEANGGWQCSHSDNYYLKRHDPPIVLATGDLVHEDYLDEAAFECRYEGKWWPREWESETVPGYQSCWDFMDPHPVEMEREVPVLPEEATWEAAHVDVDPRPVDPIVEEVYGHLKPKLPVTRPSALYPTVSL